MVPNDKLLTWTFMVGVVQDIYKLPRADQVGTLGEYPTTLEFGVDVLYTRLMGRIGAVMAVEGGQLPRAEVRQAFAPFFPPNLGGAQRKYIDRRYMHAVVEHVLPGAMKEILVAYRAHRAALRDRRGPPPNVNPVQHIMDALGAERRSNVKINRRARGYLNAGAVDGAAYTRKQL